MDDRPVPLREWSVKKLLLLGAAILIIAAIVFYVLDFARPTSSLAPAPQPTAAQRQQALDTLSPSGTSSTALSLSARERILQTLNPSPSSASASTSSAPVQTQAAPAAAPAGATSQQYDSTDQNASAKLRSLNALNNN